MFDFWPYLEFQSQPQLLAKFSGSIFLSLLFWRIYLHALVKELQAMSDIRSCPKFRPIRYSQRGIPGPRTYAKLGVQSFSSFPQGKTSVPLLSYNRRESIFFHNWKKVGGKVVNLSLNVEPSTIILYIHILPQCFFFFFFLIGNFYLKN